MTAITHDTTTGWGFTIGKQPYTGFTSRDAAAEALYDLGHGGVLYSAPAPEKAVAVALTDEQADRDALDEDTPIGTIHGCEVYGSYYNEPGEPYHGQLYGAELEWNGRTIAFRVDSNRINIDPIEHAELAGDVHLDDWQWMRALAQTDVVEQLIALVRGDAAPPALPPAALAAVAQNMADPAHRRRPSVEIDRTVEGISIMGCFDVDGAPYTVEIETGHWALTADDDGCLALCCKGSGALIELDAADGVTILRDVAHLVAGDTVERLLARARQWDGLRPPEPPTSAVAREPVSAPAPDDYAIREAARRTELKAMWRRPRAEWPLTYRAAGLAVDITALINGRDGGLDPERAAAFAGLLEPFAELDRARQIALIDAWLANPAIAAALSGELPERHPSTPAAPAIQVRPHICEDKQDPRYGTVIWLDYVCDTPAGPLEVTLDDKFPPWLYADDRELGDLTPFVQWMPAITALTNHPEIRDALIRHAAGAPQKPTKRAA